MSPQLHITAGQCSDKGCKPLNQDFHALMTPREPLLSSKGIALALADGISSSEVSQVASETSIKGFLEDYYSTSESWSVKTSVQRVLHATNSWFYAQNRGGPYRYDIEKGYVCTFSAMVLKSTTAHIFHAGDSRVYRLNGNGLEQLTEDHRVWLSAEKSYLSRALGMRDRLEIDYQAHTIAAGDTFRAAAVEQLQVWGDRAGVPVLTAAQGSDPASLAFDAMTQAQADGADLLMIDTAGRLQNRADLMEELSKIVRVIRKKDPDAPLNTLLVLDATTGQNAVQQVKVFQELSDVSGLVMTKLDGTAKGGVLVALADKFGLPIHAIGVGEQIDDLAPFDPEEFAAALTGLGAD